MPTVQDVLNNAGVKVVYSRVKAKVDDFKDTSTGEPLLNDGSTVEQVAFILAQLCRKDGTRPTPQDVAVMSHLVCMANSKSSEGGISNCSKDSKIEDAVSEEWYRCNPGQEFNVPTDVNGDLICVTDPGGTCGKSEPRVIKGPELAEALKDGKFTIKLTVADVPEKSNVTVSVTGNKIPALSDASFNLQPTGAFTAESPKPEKNGALTVPVKVEESTETGSYTLVVKVSVDNKQLYEGTLCFNYAKPKDIPPPPPPPVPCTPNTKTFKMPNGEDVKVSREMLAIGKKKDCLYDRPKQCVPRDKYDWNYRKGGCAKKNDKIPSVPCNTAQIMQGGMEGHDSKDENCNIVNGNAVWTQKKQ